MKVSHNAVWRVTRPDRQGHALQLPAALPCERASTRRLRRADPWNAGRRRQALQCQRLARRYPRRRRNGDEHSRSDVRFHPGAAVERRRCGQSAAGRYHGADLAETLPGIRRAVRREAHRTLWIDGGELPALPSAGHGLPPVQSRPGGVEMVRLPAGRSGNGCGGSRGQGGRTRRPQRGVVHDNVRLSPPTAGDRGHLAQSLFPYRRHDAPGRGRLLLLRRPQQGLHPPAWQELLVLRGRGSDPRASGSEGSGRRRRFLAL